MSFTIQVLVCHYRMKCLISGGNLEVSVWHNTGVYGKNTFFRCRRSVCLWWKTIHVCIRMPLNSHFLHETATLYTHLIHPGFRRHLQQFGHNESQGLCHPRRESCRTHRSLQNSLLLLVRGRGPEDRPYPYGPECDNSVCDPGCQPRVTARTGNKKPY